VSAAEDVASFASQLNRAAGDPDLDPGERVAALRRIRERILTARDELREEMHDRITAMAEYRALLGQADTYAGSNELAREAQALERAMDVAQLREDADVRDVLISEGVASSDELTEAGWPSHDDLDAAMTDGTVEEAVLGMFKEVLHPRERTGQWSYEPAAKGRPDSESGDAILRRLERGVEPLPKTPAGSPKAPSSPGTAEAVDRIKSAPDIASALREVRKYGLNDWPTKGPLAQQLLGDAKDTQELHTVALPATPGTEGGRRASGRTRRSARPSTTIIGSRCTRRAHVLGEEHPVTQKARQGGALNDEEKATVREAAAAKRGQAARAVHGRRAGVGQDIGVEGVARARAGRRGAINPDEIKERLPEYRR
jgi:hypothetical protein